METPAEDQILGWWELYRLKSDEIAFRERLWTPEFGRLAPEAVYEAVSPYTFEADEPVSEWRLTLSALAQFLAR
jgi:hypothetical protein